MGAAGERASTGASVTTPVPAPLKALQASLRGAREPELRARLEVAIAGVRRLYGIPEKHREDRSELRRRRVRRGH